MLDKTGYIRTSYTNVCGEEFIDIFHSHCVNSVVTLRNYNENFKWSSNIFSCNMFKIVQMYSNDGWNTNIENCYGSVGIVFPKNGHIVAKTHKDEFVSDNRSAIVLNAAGIGQTKRYGSANLSNSIYWKTEDVKKNLEAIFPETDMRLFSFSHHVDLMRPQGLALSKIVDTLMSLGEQDARVLSLQAMALLSEAALRMVFELSVPDVYERFQKNQSGVLPRHVKRAIDYMRANKHLPIRVQDIANASGVSVRALEFGFRSFRSTTPAAYLRRLRLEAARDELRNTQSTVPIFQVAFKWGFSNPGRFSQLYHTAFGEYPSSTQRGG